MNAAPTGQVRHDSTQSLAAQPTFFSPLRMASFTTD